ncbi:MAG: hypothetical protein AAFV01_16380, partial [Bacteroidota bacterium]
MPARTKSASAPSSSLTNSSSSKKTKSKKTNGQPLPPSGARGGSAGQALVIKGARQHNLKDQRRLPAPRRPRHDDELLFR